MLAELYLPREWVMYVEAGKETGPSHLCAAPVGPDAGIFDTYAQGEGVVDRGGEHAGGISIEGCEASGASGGSFSSSSFSGNYNERGRF